MQFALTLSASCLVRVLAVSSVTVVVAVGVIVVVVVVGVVVDVPSADSSCQALASSWMDRGNSFLVLMRRGKGRE